MKNSNSRPDIACLTETWLSPEIESGLVSISGYNLVRSDRKLRRGGGTALFIRNDLYFENVETETHLPQEIEGTFVDFQTSNLSILCLYIPPHLDAASLSSIRESIVGMIDRHMDLHVERRLIILGDFNHFKAEWLSVDLNLTDMVTKPTRGTKILDHILICDRLKLNYDPQKIRYESPISKSDHLTLIMEPIYGLKSPNTTRMHVVYDYRHSNIDKLLENAENIDWTLVTDPNDNVNCLLYTSPSPRDLSTSRMPSSA